MECGRFHAACRENLRGEIIQRCYRAGTNVCTCTRGMQFFFSFLLRITHYYLASNETASSRCQMIPRSPDVVDRNSFFRRENFILVLAELGGFPSTRFYWVNLEQEAAVTDRIYREKIVDRRRFVAFGLKTFAQVQEVISTDCACRSLCCSFETRSQTRPRSVNRFSSSLLDSCRE